MANNPLAQDPSRTVGLRRKFVGDMGSRFAELKRKVTELIVGLDVFGLDPTNTFSFSFNLVMNVDRQAWRFQTDERKLLSFNQWFKEQIDAGILTTDATGEPWTAKYVDSAYKKGSIRAYTDTKKEVFAQSSEFFAGSKAQFLESAFLQPERISKLRFLSTRTFEELKGISAAMSQQVGRELADGIAQGKGPAEIARNINRKITKIDRTRAKVLARTEIIAAHAEGQLDSFEDLGVEEVGILAEWSTAGDNRVCFPKFTLISTGKGVVPIHKIKQGDMVYTRKGLCEVLRVMKRKYSGGMTKIFTSEGKTICTNEHLVWTENRGWIQAKDLDSSDTLQMMDNKPVYLNRIFNFLLSDPTNKPSSFHKIFGFTSIFDRVLMPVRSVNFDSNTTLSQKEVNSIPSNFPLLNIWNTKRFKRQAYSFFYRCFRRRFSVTNEAAKPFIGSTRNTSESFTTSITVDVDRRPSAFFRTMNSVVSTSFVRTTIIKLLPARFASSICSAFRYFTTFYRTISISVLNRMCNLKVFAASGACFSYRLLTRSFITGSTAKTPSLISHSLSKIYKFFTSRAWKSFASSSALSITSMRTKSFLTVIFGSFIPSFKRFPAMIANKLKRHMYSLLSDLSILYHLWGGSQYFVYNIQVKDNPEYYANGILVHNCTRCEPLEGVVMTIAEARGLIPRHANCRCAWIPANVGERVKGRKRSKSAKQSAFDKSIQADSPNTSLKVAKRKSTWLGVEKQSGLKNPTKKQIAKGTKIIKEGGVKLPVPKSAPPGTPPVVIPKKKKRDKK